MGDDEMTLDERAELYLMPDDAGMDAMVAEVAAHGELGDGDDYVGGDDADAD